jgi:carbamoyltransferase
MKILGISGYYHDSAAAIIENGKIIAAAQEERFTRKKHDASFPINACKFCLEYSGFQLDEIDAIAFYDKPFLKFERLLETYYGFSPKGLVSFVTSIPVWLKEKVFLKKILLDELKKIGKFDRRKIKMLFPEHHLSHAASAFFPSHFDQSAILTIDGVGEWATASICIGSGNGIEVLKELHFPHSVGLLYTSFTYWLGFRVNSGEYKLMGLAPYGNPTSARVKEYIDIIKNNLVDLKEDGSIWLNQDYFSYATRLRMLDEKKWEKLFGFPKRGFESPLEQKHCDLALAIQQVTEDIIHRMALEAKRITGSKNICLAGGVALNCVANGKLLQSGMFDDIFIQPAAGDAGGAIGAALAAYHIYFNNQRIVENDSMQGAFLGPEFSDRDIEIESKRLKAHFEKIDNFDTLTDLTAKLLDEGKVIGWFQGRMEFGPRALGNRSILGDARNSDMQKKLNVKIKYRESFRPFAPSVLEEDAKDYFDLNSNSPYMLLVADVKTDRRKELPANYNGLPLAERLYFLRSDVPAITHIDFSARVQTVQQQTNKRFWFLINKFKERTGYGIVVNTSFNVRGEPIVCTPTDAYQCFMRTEMDYLIMGNFFFDKKLQPVWTNENNWKEEFPLD